MLCDLNHYGSQKLLYCVWLLSNLTSDRREVDANQQSEECGDIVDYVRHVDVLGRVTSSER